MTKVEWKRLRALSGPGDTTADGRFEVRHSGLRGQNYRWEVRDRQRHGDKPISVFSGATMKACREWVEGQYRP